MRPPASVHDMHARPNVLASIAGALTPIAIERERAARLRRQLLARVHRSVESHRHLATVRREDAPWAAVAPGVLRRTLRDDKAMPIELLRLTPWVEAPWPADACAQEILVVDGTLAVKREGAPAARLAPLGHCVIARDVRAGLRAGPAGATLYVRRRAGDPRSLGAKEASWWAAAQVLPIAAAAQPGRWTGICEGADAIALHVEGDVASMLVRVVAGAVLPDHDHGLDEDCFMLAGELFLGDILMRAGDYQRARAGSRHIDAMSDSGALFYFHGVLPAAASGATA
jgi:hypothetical protein